VTKELVLGPEGPVEDDIVFDSVGMDFPDRVHYRLISEEEVRELAQKALPLLLGLNEPAVILPVLGWFFATPFKPRLMEILDHFPFLMVHGSKESGKTSLCRFIFWRLFGVNPHTPFSVTDSDFSWYHLFSSSSSIPIFLDEYKKSDMASDRVKSLQRILRRLYGGEVERRGRADQTVNVFRLMAPVCLAGEMRPDNAALVDRMVSAAPNPNQLKAHPEYKEVFTQLRELEIECLAAPYAQFSLNRDTPADYQIAKRIADSVLEKIPEGKNASIRCRDNLRRV
jgi:DNA primase